jgi:hypothetical protein
LALYDSAIYYKIIHTIREISVMRAILLTIPLGMLWLGLNNTADAYTAAPAAPPILTNSNGATIAGQDPTNQQVPIPCNDLLVDCKAAGYKSRDKPGDNNLYTDCMNPLMADVPTMPAKLPNSKAIVEHIAECRAAKNPATASAMPATTPAAATTTPAAVVAPATNPDPGD